MATIDALSLDVTSIEGGKDPARFYTLRFLQQKHYVNNLLKKGNYSYSVIFMDTAEERIYLCMAVMFQDNQKKLDCFHS